MNTDKLAIILDAGPHARRESPVQLTLPAALPDGHWELFDGDGDRLPLQCGPGATGWIVAPKLRPGEAREYRVRQTAEPEAAAKVVRDGDTTVQFSIDGLPVTSYIFEGVPARPYFFPLIGPDGVQLTRHYPMEDYPGESRDHPHHRSLWIAHGDVNGVDNWSEEPGHGRTRHRSFKLMESGSVCARIVTESLWTDNDGAPVLTQNLEVRLWAMPGDARMLDFSIELASDYGDVRFGDTKEGGILSARVANAMDVQRGGRIENTYGGIDEGETWGRAAHWCDYSGTVDERSVGLAIMDYPHSFRYPTHWHVRNYGLMTANPFGYSAYTGGRKDGAFTLKANERIAFHYRTVLHSGNALNADIRGRYLDFVSPPKASVHTGE